jgi:glycosyltransferase involved in cell wall biosynthesis
MLKFSVLIPTYQRREKLAKMLDLVAQQTGLSDGEVIVGVDGSTDGTLEYLQKRSLDYPCPLHFFRIENSGRSVIRNQLIDRAKGDILIFIQDDIMVRQSWLESHLHAHQDYVGAVIGHVTWYPKQNISAYMEWLENGGHMLDFSSLRDGHETDFWHFYMGNLSVPRNLIKSLRFDETLPCYGWEDILFGLAFVREGNKVYYKASASAFHWDEYLEENLGEYMQKVGRSAVVAEQKYPGTGFLPPTWKRFIFKMMIFLTRPIFFLLPQRWRWYVEMKREFLVAVRKG